MFAVGSSQIIKTVFDEQGGNFGSFGSDLIREGDVKVVNGAHYKKEREMMGKGNNLAVTIGNNSLFSIFSRQWKTNMKINSIKRACLLDQV